MAIYSLDMSYQDQSGGYPPPRDQPESQYPPPPGEEDDRARAYHQRVPSNSVTLPSISPYDPQYAQQNGYPPDPRAYQQDPYRAPPGPYRDDRAYQQDYGRGGPQHMAFSQSAPRQRTAIACRYCRRRKVSDPSRCDACVLSTSQNVSPSIVPHGYRTFDFERMTSRLFFSEVHTVPNTFCRFAAQDSIKIQKDVVPTANDSNKSVSSLPFRPKLRLSSQLMPSILACEIWVLAQMVVLVR